VITEGFLSITEGFLSPLSRRQRCWVGQHSVIVAAFLADFFAVVLVVPDDIAWHN
jgi:hypothetical protein